MSPELRRNLIWRYSALGNLAPRTAPFEQQGPMGAHTDAQGRGHIAAVYLAEQRVSANAHLPEWLCLMAEAAEGESPIFLYELCAAILMVYIANHRWGDTPRTCVLRVDNKAAAASLVKGSSSPNLAGVLVSLFWNVAARGNARWWIEYVNTKSNSADSPSRQCKLPTEAVCSKTQGRIPTEFREEFASCETLRREATVFTKQNK